MPQSVLVSATVLSAFAEWRLVAGDKLLVFSPCVHNCSYVRKGLFDTYPPFFHRSLLSCDDLSLDDINVAFYATSRVKK